MMSIIIGCVSLLSGYIRMTFSSISAERQVRTIRKKLFQSILEKDVAFFDQHQTGQLSLHLTDSINKIGKGIGEKLTAAIEMLATFISCFIVGKVLSFENSWRKIDCSIVKRFHTRMEIIACYCLGCTTYFYSYHCFICSKIVFEGE